MDFSAFSALLLSGLAGGAIALPSGFMLGQVLLARRGKH